MIGEKVELRLENTSTQDVLLILEDRIKNSRMKSQARQFISDSYADGITRTITTHDNLNNPRRENNKITIQGTSYQERFPSKEDLTAAEILNFPLTYDALIFTVFQIQLDVLLRLEYSQQWQEFVDSVMSDLDSLFHKQPSQVTPIPTESKAPDKAAQPVNTIADNLGGTITYRRNEQGQGMAIKPEEQIRLNHTAGIIQPGYEAKNEQEANAIEVVNASHNLLAGLVGKSDEKQLGLTPKPEKKGKVFLRTKALWKELGFFYRSNEYKTAKQGIDHMRKKHPKFRMSEKTMDKIIREGLAGKYD